MFAIVCTVAYSLTSTSSNVIGKPSTTTRQSVPTSIRTTTSIGSQTGSTNTLVRVAGVHSPGFVETITATLVTPSKQAGIAPFTVHFRGTITVSARCTVEYTFNRSDGSTSSQRWLDFTGAGSKNVSDAWAISTNYSGWETIHISSPRILDSKKSDFTYTVRTPTKK